MQHYITLLLGQIALTQHGAQTRWDGVSLQNAVVAMLVKCALKNKSVSPAKHPHTITPPPPCFTVGTTHAEIIR